MYQKCQKAFPSKSKEDISINFSCFFEAYLLQSFCKITITFVSLTFALLSVSHIVQVQCVLDKKEKHFLKSFLQEGFC